jgi:putative transcriptional regulator
VELNDQLIKLGLKVRELRLSKSLSQTDLAFKIGKDQPSINRLEKGKINPSILYLLEIANGLEIPVSKLLEDF